LRRPFGADLVPRLDALLSARLPHLLQVGDGQRLDPRVARVHDHGQRVERDRQLDILDARRAARLHLFLQDRARGIGNVGLAAAEALDAAARAGNADGHAHLAALADLELFRNRLGDREYRAGAVDLDDALRRG